MKVLNKKGKAKFRVIVRDESTNDTGSFGIYEADGFDLPSLLRLFAKFIRRFEERKIEKNNN